MLHVFGEAAKVHDVFFELGAGDEGSAAFLAVGEAAGLQAVEGLAGGHAADLIEAGQLLFGGEGISGDEFAGADFFHQGALDLIVERDEAALV